MELGTEKSATQKLESGKLVLERQNKELKAKLNELETNQRTKTKVGWSHVATCWSQRLLVICVGRALATILVPAPT